MDTIASLVLSHPENFPRELKESPHWIQWQPTWSDERNKFLKLPIHGKKWQSLRLDFSMLPDPLPPAHGYGFLYSDEHTFICIDIDDATPENARLVELLDSYTEWSPSGNGAHVIVCVLDPSYKSSLVKVFGPVSHNKQAERDLFISSGYVTITGRMIHRKPIKALTPLALQTILTPYFNPLVRDPQLESVKPKLDNNKTKAKWQPNFAQIKATLDMIPVAQLTSESFKTFKPLDSDCTTEARDAWLIVGQALHDIDNGNLLHANMWQDWSRLGNKYDEHALWACWRSFNTSTINSNTGIDNSTAQASTITWATVQKLANAQRPQYIDFTNTTPPKVMATLGNIKIYLDWLDVKVRYNTVTNNMEIILPQKLSQNITDPDNAAYILESEMLKQGFRDASLVRRIKVQLKLMPQNLYNPIKDYFTTTLPEWDGQTRIPQLMNTITPLEGTSVQDLQVYEAYVRAWLIQVTAAVFTTKERPNRLNNVLILQGDQGVGKTMWVESLFPPGLREYCVGSKSVNMSQFRNDMVKLTMELTNTLICNINEIDTVFRAKTYSEFKSFLDNTTDKIVLPYGYGTTDILRSTVFIGSTNKAQLFTDTTGNRRFMLLQAQSYNFKHNIDLDQLWAEAYHYYKAGEKWYFTDKDAVVKKKQEYDNANALNVMDDMFLDKLNTTFDTAQKPVKWMTFPQICTILGTALIRNDYEFRVAKTTLIHWLSILYSPSVVKLPTCQGTPAKFCMPPLRTIT